MRCQGRWWAEGVGSSIYETSLNRQTEELLPVLDLLSTQVDGIEPELIEEAYQLVSLYDEHTWGGFASIRRPHSHFTRANFNRKAGRKLATQITDVTPEGEAWRRWGQYISADPAAETANYRYLVVNPLGWERHIRYPMPPDMGGAAPFAELGASGIFMHAEPQGQCELQLKPAADGRGIIVHAYNLGMDAVAQSLSFPAGTIKAARICSPTEVDFEPVTVKNDVLTFEVPSRSVACARVIFVD